MPKITINKQMKVVDYNPAMSLFNNFHILGVPVGSVCGGRGNCGTCRIKVIEGQRFMSPPSDMERYKLKKEELEEGWRLSCQSHAIRDLEVFIPEVVKDKKQT